jgi:predicted  nucleic acid-binding Zn-ribbon protein
LPVRDQLTQLLRIQEIVLKVRAARKTDSDAPGRLQEIEERFCERNAEYVAVKERYDALDADQQKRSDDLLDLEEHKTKYMADLMQVQNQREYAAMLKEIDAVKSQIAQNEEAILSDLEEIEQVKTDLASHEEHIQEERKLVEKESTAVHAEAEQARKTMDELDEERRKVEAELPRNLVATVRRLEAGRGGVFLSEAIDGTCQSCYVRVRPQVFQEIRRSLKLHTCSNCRRLLYHEPTLRPAPATDEVKPGGDPMEAVNGGAV